MCAIATLVINEESTFSFTNKATYNIHPLFDDERGRIYPVYGSLILS